MSTPTNIQIITQNAQPAFVVIPYDEYIKAFPEKPWVPESDLIPHDAVGLVVKKGYTLIRAWREYLGLTQREVAKKIGVTQAPLSQMESGEQKLRKATLEKIAAALDLGLEQVKG